jgi:aromatic ring hydroxylase
MMCPPATYELRADAALLSGSLRRAARNEDNIRNHVKRVIQTDPFHVSANTDPKGDRSKPPREQDPDMLLHVVEDNDRGVVVRGAKYETAAAYANQAFTKPTIANWGNEAYSDYAVGFVCDLGSPNLKFICRTGFAGRAPEKYYSINENRVAEDRRKLLAFARDLVNSDYAGHRLTFQLFAQSPPFAHLAAVYRSFGWDGPLDFVGKSAGLSDRVVAGEALEALGASGDPAVRRWFTHRDSPDDSP